MKREPLYVALGRDQVAVHTDDDSVRLEVQRTFREMLVPEFRKVVTRVEIHQTHHSYHLTRVRAAGDQLLISSGSLADVLAALEGEVLIGLMQAHEARVWLHAGAAACQNRAVVILAPSGGGKSTVVAGLCRRGWSYLSDDCVPLDLNSGEVIPFPQTPMVRQDPGNLLSQEQVRKLPREEINLQPETVSRNALPLGALVFSAYCFQGETQLRRCSAAVAALRLLQFCIHSPKPRQAVMHRLCSLVSGIPSFELVYSRGDIAAGLIAQVCLSEPAH